MSIKVASLTSPRQADWSADNLPEIQYYLFPPADRDAFRRKPIENLRDANGQVVFEQWPKPGQAARPLKDFPVLPRQVDDLYCRYAWDSLTK